MGLPNPYKGWTEGKVMDKEVIRADFEKWVKRLLPSASLDRDPTYVNSYVYIAWRTWDAAERHYRAATPTETNLVRELRRRCNTKLSLLHQSAWYEAANELEKILDEARAATKAERCPTCASNNKEYRAWKEPWTQTRTERCGDAWHSPAPAPTERRSDEWT